MARPAPRHLKKQPSRLSTLPATGRAGTVLATGAVMTVPTGVAGVALADGAAAVSSVPQAATPGMKASVKSSPSSSVVVLRYGSRGSLVTTLQKRLNIPADGIFGARTLRSVKIYQKAKGLVADGIVGQATWRALGIEPGGGGGATCSSYVVRYGATGGVVKALQTRLNIPSDGIFGAHTLRAVKTYQTRKGGLVVDGIVGPATWRALGGYPCGVGGPTTPPSTPPGGGGRPGGGIMDPSAAYKMPFPGGSSYRISQGPFGTFSHNDLGDRHAIDFAMPTGASLAASRSGYVYRAGWNTGGGNMVWIKDASGFCQQYLHLSSIGVYKGQRVSQGQIIGRAGNTGHSFGSHLHFGIVDCDSYRSVMIPNTQERGTSYPVGVTVTSQNY